MSANDVVSPAPSGDPEDKLAIPTVAEASNGDNNGIEVDVSKLTGHAKMIAVGTKNLVHWKKGQSGNPKGRLPLGLSFVEWLNAMQRYKGDKLRKVASDRSQPQLRRAAAKQLLQTCSERTTTAGVPIRGEALDRICDRTYGKPTQAVELSGPDGAAIQIDQRTTDLAACMTLYQTFRTTAPTTVDNVP